MRVYESPAGIGNIYLDVFNDLEACGRPVTVRGLQCVEAPEPVTLVYKNPAAHWMCIPGRRFNPFFALAEVVWILSGNGSVEWISYFNHHMRQFADGGKNEFHGAYGPRIRRWSVPGSRRAFVDQIFEVVVKLGNDPNSRQAVISLWDPVRDNLIKSRDYPCNNIVYFSLRDGRLDCTVAIRSNDIIWGTPYNAIQFSHIQALVAGELRAGIGSLTYVIQNLHYYLDLYPEALFAVRNSALKNAGQPRLLTGEILGFSPTTEAEFRRTAQLVEGIRQNRLCPQEALNTLGFFGGYWGYTVPLAIWLYCTIKEGLFSAPEDYLFVAERIRSFGDPLESLIIDFYSQSSNVHAREVLHQWKQLAMAHSGSSSKLES